MESQQELLRW